MCCRDGINMEIKESEWAIFLTEKEIRLIHECMIHGWFDCLLKKKVSYEDSCELSGIIKDLGRIA